MIKKFYKTMIASLLSAAMLLGAFPVCASATETTETTQTTESAKETEVTEEGDNVEIKKGDKPYLSLGADLTTDQETIVLSLMEIEYADLGNYDVSYVTNAEEHQYLDSYVDSSKIGTRALSSVVITEGKKGSGLNISTYNINYCTVGMYKNALTTAGITDANIIIAGPSSISGTAALIGIYKAYEDMTGKDVAEDLVDASLDELVTTGDLEQELTARGIDAETIEAIIAELKQKLSDGDMDTEEEMKSAINEIATEYDVTLTDEEIQEIVDLLNKLKSLNLNWDLIEKQAGEIANKVEKLINSEEGQNLIQSIINFFKNLFK